MDLSKEYIDMCAEAKEIQELWKLEIGDYVEHRYTVFGEKLDTKFWDDEKLNGTLVIRGRSEPMGKTFYRCTNVKENMDAILTDEEFERKCNVWIPRLDQLLEIAFTCAGFMTMKLDLIDSHILNPEKSGRTIEKAVLESIIETKYSKRWNGKKWITKKLKRKV